MSRCIIITGAASGLGLALATEFATQPCDLLLLDKDIQGAQALASKLASEQVSCQAVECDITQDEDIASFVAQLDSQGKQIDVLVNNAGVATAGALDFESIEQWQWVLNINLLGMVRLTQALHKRIQPGGQIINIASQAGITPIPMMASYNASKAAVVSFSETMHLELAHQGIHVCVACPSFFATNLDKSLRSTQPGVDKLMQKFLSRSDITAQQVAQSIITQAQDKVFLILTHKAGKQAYWLKRLLPARRYLNMIKRKTQHLGKIK